MPIPCVSSWVGRMIVVICYQVCRLVRWISGALLRLIWIQNVPASHMLRSAAKIIHTFETLAGELQGYRYWTCVMSAQERRNLLAK